MENPWGIILTAAVGAGLPAAVFWFILLWQIRQRQKRSERPPVAGKLLRPPGHTISNQLEACHERLLPYLAIMIAAGVICAIMFTPTVRVLLSQDVRTGVERLGLRDYLLSREIMAELVPAVLLIVGGVCGVIWGAGKSLSLLEHMRGLHLGLRGEQCVGEALVETGAEGYRAFHDFPGGKTGNIDHVVVGPGGVFAIETRTRSKNSERVSRGMKEYEVIYDGNALQFPWGVNREYLEQARRNAKFLSDFLAKSTGLQLRVNPVLVLPGWHVSVTNDASKHEVQAMPGTMLTKYLRALPPRLSSQEIQQVVSQLDLKCRDVEF